MARRTRPRRSARVARPKMRRGGRAVSRPRNARVRKMAHGGMHNGCPPGMHMMPDGTCMQGTHHGASAGQYRRGGVARKRPKMRRGGRVGRRFQTGGRVTNNRMNRGVRTANVNNRTSTSGPPTTIIDNIAYYCPPGVVSVNEHSCTTMEVYRTTY